MLTVAVFARARLVRQGVASLLQAQPDLQVTSVAPAWDEFVAQCDDGAHRPVDVAVAALDERTQPGDGLDLMLRRVNSRSRLVVVAPARLAVQPPPGGIVVPPTDPAARLVAAVRGEAPHAVRTPETEVGAVLTPRERSVAELLASGAAAADVAARLGISRHTVENHARRIYEKLGIRTRAQLASCFARGRDLAAV